MRRGLLLVLILVSGLATGDEDLSVKLVDLAVPRDGTAVSRHPVLSAAAVQLLDTPDARLEVHYPGGDEGSLRAVRAGELRAWFVALGIESERVELVPGSKAADRIDLRVSRQ
jgi:hypothetical protein